MRLFIDDERDPPNDGNEWNIARNVGDVIRFMYKNGCPNFISFDHDLGDQYTGKYIADWIIAHDLDDEGNFIPKDFDFYVHSQNPVGARNIELLLRAYLKQRNT